MRLIPLNVGRFGPAGMVLAADDVGNLVEQFAGAFVHFGISLTAVKDWTILRCA